MSGTRPEPSDHTTRHRFITELDKNFSVIAPAGVGKTAAIVDRVIEIATSDRARALEWLPRLAVVTYTNRAADEMRQRARNEILRKTTDQRVLNGFSQAFFGTIHSFCLGLLRRHGHAIGLPSQLDLARDDEALWLEFVRQTGRVGSSVAGKHREKLFRHRSMLDVMKLGRVAAPSSEKRTVVPPFPGFNFDPALKCPPSNRSKGAVERGQRILRQWLNTCESKEAFAPLPVYTKGGKEFQRRWNDAFAPLRKWLGDCSWIVARETAQNYRNDRISKGFMTYGDQIALAVELLNHPKTGRLIREQEFRVILDEAQDTDPMQFHVLTEITRPPEVSGNWIDDGKNPPRRGHFCMVGDPQQSIYGERADLSHYLRVHERLKQAPGSDCLRFNVTFRCDQAVIASVNQLASPMLDGQEGQVDFVPLQSRPGVATGQVVCRKIEPHADWVALKRKPKIGMVARVEAVQLAKWLKQQGLERLRAARWSEVAVLCPRKNWFHPLERALQETGLRAQIHSPNDIRGDNPSFAWLTALIVVVSQPRNHFEIVGVLREIFGLSDQDLADFSNGNGSVFQIESEAQGKSDAAEALNLLARTRSSMLTLPLRDAVRKLNEETRLNERLSSLPINKPEDVKEQLDKLLIQAATAEADGLSIHEWAETLTEEYWEPREDQTIQPDAIQLITCQKAKGLQWDAVILPFFFRPILTRGDSRYPRIVKSPDGKNPLALLGPEDLTEEAKEILSREQRNEMQRILYVALTRAKKTLVLVNDFRLFKTKEGAPEKSFAGYLGLNDGENVETWKGFSTELTLSPQTDETRVNDDSSPSQRSAPGAQRSPDLQSALERARNFPRRTLPHSLAKHRPESPDEPEQRLDLEPEGTKPHERNAGLQYGTWWHESVQGLLWAKKETWNDTMEKMFGRSPDRRRAETEWKMFLKSELAARLSRPDLVIHSEMPFLWRQDAAHCVEGLIDLAVFDPKAGEWLIVDWKTDQIGSADADPLLQRYSPQIKAYLHALGALTGRPVRGTLYSTATGRELDLNQP